MEKMTRNVVVLLLAATAVLSPLTAAVAIAEEDCSVTLECSDNYPPKL